MSRDAESRCWQPPDRLASGMKRWGWTDDIISDSERWLQSQPFWNDLSRAEDLIRGKECVRADENRSDLTSNRLKSRFREMVAALSDVRHPDAWSSSNKAYAESAAMFSTVSKGIWYDAKASMSFRRMVQWMVGGGSGYLWPVYRRRRILDPNSNGICFDDYGPRDVLPFMTPPDNNIQGSYAVTMIRMRPLPDSHARFPEFQDRISPVSKRRMQSNAVLSRMQFIDSMRGGNNSGTGADKFCEERYTLVRDLSINDTGMPIPMGEPGASWSYVVPTLGADIPAMDVNGGKRGMRKATIDDCRLYPNLRLITTVSGVVVPVYDGPAYAWHGMFPPRFSADDWAWEAMGFSLIRDVYDTEATRQFTERAIDMKIKAQMDPALLYDQTQINPGTAEEFDPWEMRKRLGVDGDPEKALRTAIPESMLKVGSEPFTFLEYLAASEDEAQGTDQINAGDLLRMAGPIVRDISATMETPFSDMLEMVKYLILQNLSTGEVMTYVGPDGVTPVTFDFDPASLVPGHMPGEDTGNPSQFSRQERAKNFARNLKIQIAPGGIHGLPQTQQKLLLLQGSRAGSPIPQRIIFEKVYGLTNYEQLRDEWRADKEWELEMAAKLKIEGASLLPGSPPGTSTPSGSQKGSGGRPASGSKPPAAKTKASASGPRAVVSESG